MADSKKCAHTPCTCIVTEGDYCSEICEDSAGTTEIACDCPHPSCGGHL